MVVRKQLLPTTALPAMRREAEAVSILSLRT